MEKAHRRSVYVLALNLLNNGRSSLDAASRDRVLQNGFKDDLAVRVQLTFWSRYGCWRLNCVEEEELSKQSIFCKVCTLEFKIGFSVTCIPAIQSGILLDLGHLFSRLGDTQKKSATGNIPIRLSERVFTALKTASSSIMKTSSQELVKIQASDQHKQEQAAAQECDPSVYFVYPDASIQIDLQKDVERLYSVCKVVSFSFMHWNCFQARILACRQSEEADPEILPAQWSTAISWIFEELEESSSLKTTPNISKDGQERRFFGSL